MTHDLTTSDVASGEMFSSTSQTEKSRHLLIINKYICWELILSIFLSAMLIIRSLLPRVSSSSVVQWRLTSDKIAPPTACLDEQTLNISTAALDKNAQKVFSTINIYDTF